MDSQQNMMKDNAAKACLRQINLTQEKKAKYCRTLLQQLDHFLTLLSVQFHVQ
jgi:hypothetical protein